MRGSCGPNCQIVGYARTAGAPAAAAVRTACSHLGQSGRMVGTGRNAGAYGTSAV
jgi:hypothetical protein